MKWSTLEKLISGLTTEEKDTDIAIQIGDETWSGHNANLLINKNLLDTLDDGHPYLEICK